MFRHFTIAAATLLAGAAPAFAHLDPEAHGSLLAGLSHPVFGLDHVLAMVAVGLWAAQMGGRAVFVVPAAFVGTMALGFALGLGGMALPFVEPGILASVVVLGLLVAVAARLPVPASAAVVGAFALLHGHAHAGELGIAGAFQFGLGFLVATAFLHMAGVGLGLGQSAGSANRSASSLSRVAGLGTALAGLALMAG
ncbi:MAG: HupE/UreJ family protein [Rhizobiaceae bacterium]|nr:HupE/UreJ family protein [Rhizobiaceae bacterium]